MTFPLRVARETVKEAFGVANPDLAAGDVYELEKLAKRVIERCAEVVTGTAGCDCTHAPCKHDEARAYAVARIEALATEEES